MPRLKIRLAYKDKSDRSRVLMANELTHLNQAQRDAIEYQEPEVRFSMLVGILIGLIVLAWITVRYFIER